MSCMYLGMYVVLCSCPVYTPVTLSVNAISQQLERVRCSPRSMLDPRQYLTVELFEIPKDKDFSEVRTAKLDLPRQRGPEIARGCNVPGGLQEKSLESAPLVNPCSNIAQQNPIEVLEGGYGHNIGLRCVPGVPPGPSHGSPRELHDGT